MKNISIIIGDITKFGGTERAVSNLANLLAQNYRICIISIYRPISSVPQFLIDDRVIIKYLSIRVPDKKYKILIQYFNIFFFLRRVIKQNGANFVISTAHAFSFMLPFLVLFLSAKSIAAEHITRDSLPFFSKMLQRISYPFLYAVVLLSETARSRYSFCRNTFVIPNSLPFFSEKPAELSSKIILSVGRFSYEKGFDRLVEMASLMRDSFLGWKIMLFGNGALEADLREQIDEKGLSDYIVVNDVVKDIQKEYLNSSIYLMTSRFEAFPMVLLEAKSCGLPVVAYDCPEGPREIIKNGYDGFLIEDGNAESMVEKLSLLMFNDKLRMEIGLNARNSVADYRDEEIKDKWNHLLHSIL